MHHGLPKLMHLVTRAKGRDFAAGGGPTGQLAYFLNRFFLQVEQSNDEPINRFEANEELVDELSGGLPALAGKILIGDCELLNETFLFETEISPTQLRPNAF